LDITEANHKRLATIIRNTLSRLASIILSNALDRPVAISIIN